MLKSLQGARVLAMLGIFLFHSGILIKGTFPVTFFFILSGFVIYYNYQDKFTNINLKEIYIWVIKRMKNLYIVHIITFIISIFVRMNWLENYTMLEILKMGFLNLTLTQSLSKKPLTFNGLSWFLSITFILYIVAIPIIICIKRIKEKNTFLNLIILLIIQFIIVQTNNIVELPLYTSPFYRVFDFMIGMLVAKIFIENREKENKINYTVVEIAIIIVFVVMYIPIIFTDKITNYGLNYFSIIFILFIYFFAIGKGFISKILAGEIFQKIAVISFEFYMIHELVLMVSRKVFSQLNFHWLINNIIIAIPSFIISFIGAIMLNKIVKCMFKKRGKLNNEYV